MHSYHAYLPKHNTVLWKEICWGDIRLFLRRLGLNRADMKVSVTVEPEFILSQR